MSKIAIIIGTRAEYIKCFTILHELDVRGIPYEFIHTGQHSLGDFCKKFKTKEPDIIINARNGFNSDTGGAFKWGLQTLPKIVKYLKSKKDICFVVVQGDTIACALGCFAGRLVGKKVVHVEAGLRSGNIFSPAPEEAIRQTVDFLSDVKFAVSEKVKKNLRGEVYNVGNTCYDALEYALTIPNELKLHLPDKYAVCTFHRHETLKDKNKMRVIVNILSYSQIPVYLFMHKNTEVKLKKYRLWPLGPNIVIHEPLPYEQIIRVLKNAQFVISDSGGVQEECAALNIPFICLRGESERDELFDRPDQVLTKLDEETGKLAIMKYSLPRKPYKLYNPYKQSKSASEQIVDVLLEKVRQTPKRKVFKGNGV